MSGDCGACVEAVEAVEECARVLAALVRRLDGKRVELTADELARFTLTTAVVFSPGDAEGSLLVEIRETGTNQLAKEAPCGS